MRDIKAESKDPDLRVQLDVFEEQKESDEGQVMFLSHLSQEPNTGEEGIAFNKRTQFLK